MDGLTHTHGVRLTKREQEVLSCIGEGMTSKQIAGRLYISAHTVDNHRKNMLAKTGAHNSAELVKINFEKKSI